MIQTFSKEADLSAYLQRLLADDRPQDEDFTDYLYLDEALATIAAHAERFELDQDFLFRHLFSFCCDSMYLKAKAFGLYLLVRQQQADRDIQGHWEHFYRCYLDAHEPNRIGERPTLSHFLAQVLDKIDSELTGADKESIRTHGPQFFSQQELSPGFKTKLFLCYLTDPLPLDDYRVELISQIMRVLGEPEAVIAKIDARLKPHESDEAARAEAQHGNVGLSVDYMRNHFEQIRGCLFGRATKSATKR